MESMKNNCLTQIFCSISLSNVGNSILLSIFVCFGECCTLYWTVLPVENTRKLKPGTCRLQDKRILSLQQDIFLKICQLCQLRPSSFTVWRGNYWTNTSGVTLSKLMLVFNMPKSIWSMWCLLSHIKNISNYSSRKKLLTFLLQTSIRS